MRFMQQTYKKPFTLTPLDLAQTRRGCLNQTASSLSRIFWISYSFLPSEQRKGYCFRKFEPYRFHQPKQQYQY